MNPGDLIERAVMWAVAAFLIALCATLTVVCIRIFWALTFGEVF